MQPCAVCGSMGTDQAGYCTQCRSFVGPPAGAPGQAAGPAAYQQDPFTPVAYQQDAYPQAGQPSAQYQQADYPQAGADYPQAGYPAADYPAAGYPQSAAPYAGPVSGSGPVSGGGYQPGYPDPGYPAPGYPQSGYPQPGYPQAAPVASARNRSSFTVLLIGLSTTLVLLVAGIITVIVLKSGDDRGDSRRTAGGQASAGASADPSNGWTPSPGASSLVDKCVVGTWKLTLYQETVQIDGVGPVTFTGNGQGAQLRLAADGSGLQDFGEGMALAATATIAGSSVRINLLVSGTLTYDYRTSGGSFTYTDVVPSGSIRVTSNNGVDATEPLSGTSEPASYTCEGNQLVSWTSTSRSEMTRA